MTYRAEGKTCVGTESLAAGYVDDRPGYACPEGYAPAGNVRPNAECRLIGQSSQTERPIRVDLFECPSGFTSADALLTEDSVCTRTVIVPIQAPGKGTAEEVPVPTGVDSGGGGSQPSPASWPLIGLLVIGAATAAFMSVRTIASRRG